MKIEIAFIFTNFNSSLATITLINSLLGIDDFSKCQCVIVDNNSDAEQISMLKDIAMTENIHVLFSQTNVGYFQGLNIGLNYLWNSKFEFDFAVIGNNDLIFPDNFIESVFKNRKLFDNYAVISPNIITADGEYQNPHVIQRIGFFRELIYDLYYFNYNIAKLIKKVSSITYFITDRKDESQNKIGQVIYQGHGSCYILGPVYFLSYKELFAPTFLFGEELFLSIQLQKMNLQLYYEPSITVIHQCHTSLDKLPSKKTWEIAKISHQVYRSYVKPWAGKYKYSKEPLIS